MALSPEQHKAKEAQLVRQMAKKLQSDIVALQKYQSEKPPKAFLEFCTIRNKHAEIQGLIFVIQDKMGPVLDLLPDHMEAWLIQAKLKAVTIFVEISRDFVSDPPLTLTGSLTARDVLTNEQKSFTESLAFFNKVLMEQAVDDKLADRLDRTLGMIEETIGIIDRLLSKSRNYLEEFV